MKFIKGANDLPSNKYVIARFWGEIGHAIKHREKVAFRHTQGTTCWAIGHEDLQHLEWLDESVKDEVEKQELGAVWVKASEKVPADENLYHLNYGTGKTKMKTTGFYDGEKWHRQDGAVLDWHPNLKWLDESPNEQPVEQKENEAERNLLEWLSKRDINLYSEYKKQK
jgi:hypothetical protein